MKAKVDEFIPTTYCKRIGLCPIEDDAVNIFSTKKQNLQSNSVCFPFSVHFMVINVNAVKIILILVEIVFVVLSVK